MQVRSQLKICETLAVIVLIKIVVKICQCLTLVTLIGFFYSSVSNRNKKLSKANSSSAIEKSLKTLSKFSISSTRKSSKLVQCLIIVNCT